MKLLNFSKMKEKRGRLNQIQGTNIQEFFVLKKADEGFIAVSPPAFCKDYLQDILTVELLKGNVSDFDIYGMKYKYNELLPTENSYFYIGINFYSANISRDYIPENHVTVEAFDNMLNAIEKMFKLETVFERNYSFIEKIDSRGNIESGQIIIGIPREIYKSLHKFSFVTLLLRNFWNCPKDCDLLEYYSRKDNVFGSSSDKNGFFSLKTGNRILKLLLLLKFDNKILDYSFDNLVTVVPGTSNKKYKNIDHIDYDIHSYSGISNHLSRNSDMIDGYLNELKTFKTGIKKYEKILS